MFRQTENFISLIYLLVFFGVAAFYRNQHYWLIGVATILLSLFIRIMLGEISHCTKICILGINSIVLIIILFIIIFCN